MSIITNIRICCRHANVRAYWLIKVTASTPIRSVWAFVRPHSSQPRRAAPPLMAATTFSFTVCLHLSGGLRTFQMTQLWAATPWPPFSRCHILRWRLSHIMMWLVFAVPVTQFTWAPCLNILRQPKFCVIRGHGRVCACLTRVHAGGVSPDECSLGGIITQTIVRFGWSFLLSSKCYS